MFARGNFLNFRDYLIIIERHLLLKVTLGLVRNIPLGCVIDLRIRLVDRHDPISPGCPSVTSLCGFLPLMCNLAIVVAMHRQMTQRFYGDSFPIVFRLLNVVLLVKFFIFSRLFPSDQPAVVFSLVHFR